MSERTIANLGWVLAAFSLSLTATTLLPAFKAQAMTQDELDLARWTAMKDYVKQCHAVLVRRS